MEEKELQHMVIGHSQIRNLEKYHFPDTPGINFHIDVLSYSGGHASRLAEVIKDEISSASRPLRISAIIWQNSNWTTTLSQVEDIVMDIEDFLKDYPFHRVAFPECLFVPQQEEIWDKVARINTILGNYNKRQGFDRYPLHKVAMYWNTNTKAFTVRQTSYREYNQDLTASQGRADHNANNLGYHIDEGAPKRRYAQHIRNFHKYGFNENKERPINQLPPQRISNTVYFAGNPVNKMKSPKEADARVVINMIKQNNNVTAYKADGFDDLNIQNDNDPHKPKDGSKDLEEEEEVQIIEPVDQGTAKLTFKKGTAERAVFNEWLEQGKENGYLKAVEKLIEIKSKVKEKTKNMKRKKEEMESSSDNDSESSSSSDSESSSSESESSSSDSDASNSSDSDIPKKIKEVEKYLMKKAAQKQREKEKMKERKKKEKKKKEKKDKERKKKEKKKQEQKKEEKKKQEKKKKMGDHGEKKAKKH